MNDAFNLLYNHDLTPQLEKAANLQSVVKQMEWCPAGGVQSFRRCVLAYVTNAGQVSIIGYKYTSWCEILDLSEIWVAHCRSTWGIVSSATRHQISELMYRTGRIKITAITWMKSKNSDSKTSHLITASQDGIITFWKVFNLASDRDSTGYNDFSDVKKTKILSANVLKSFDSKLTHINTLHWHEIMNDTGLLIVSNNAGVISYFKDVQINDDNRSYLREDIWSDEDKIPVTKITSWNYRRGFTCISVKGSFVIVVYIDTSSNRLSVCYRNTGMRIISGLQKINENSILISSRNNKFSIINLTLSDDDGDISIEEEAIECGFTKVRHALHGFALSRNKVLGTAILSVTGAYDHIVLREPTSLLFFSLSEINEPLDKMLSSNFQQINDVWDCFDVVRWQILNKIIAYALPDNMQTELDTMELKQLIIMMWLTKFLTTAAEIDEMDDGEGTDGIINKDKSTALMNTFEEIEELVFSCNIFKRCANLMTNIMNLSTFDKESLALMRKWLDHLILSLPENHVTTRSSASTILEEINDLLEKHSIALPETEICSICKDDVPCLTGFKTSRCRRGHTLLRCSLSLVQISYHSNYRCSRCNAVAHEKAVSGENTNCVFCNSTLRIDGRLLDIQDDTDINEEILLEEMNKLLKKHPLIEESNDIIGN